METILVTSQCFSQSEVLDQGTIYALTAKSIYETPLATAI